jgi:hypothetical protein
MTPSTDLVSLTDPLIQVGSFREDQNTGLRGTISFSTPGGRFPAEQWTDAPAVLLADWMKRFGRLARGKAHRTQFGFMEGPYAVRAEAQAGDVVLTFIDRGRRNRERAGLTQTRVSIGALGTALLNAAALTLNAAQQADWAGVDVDRLETELHNLGQELKRLASSAQRAQALRPPD